MRCLIWPIELASTSCRGKAEWNAFGLRKAAIRDSIFPKLQASALKYRSLSRRSGKLSAAVGGIGSNAEAYWQQLGAASGAPSPLTNSL